MNILAIEGIGPAYAKKLRDHGIRSTEALLKAGADPGGCRQLATSTGLDEDDILEWIIGSRFLCYRRRHALAFK